MKCDQQLYMTRIVFPQLSSKRYSHHVTMQSDWTWTINHEIVEQPLLK